MHWFQESDSALTEDEKELARLRRDGAILEKAEAAYKIAIPGMVVAIVMSVILLFTQTWALSLATGFVWAGSLGALRVGRHYTNQVY